MLSVNTNVNSLVSQTALATTQAQLAQATQRLSTGLRINSAKDDAAGLAVSQLMSAQVASLNQAVQNANDGINMLQTADGAISNQQNIVQRMRTLAVEGASSTIDDTSRSYINTELQQLMAGSNAIASSTKFNGQSLLTGSMSTSQSGGTALVGKQLNTTGGNASISAVDVSGAKANDTFTLTTGGGKLTLTRTSDGVAQTITPGAIAANSTEQLNFSSLGVKINVTTDGGGKTAAGLATDAAALTITTGAGTTAATFQVGADSSAGNSFAVTLANTQIDTTANGAASAMDTLNTALTNFNTTSNVANASALLTAVDGAIGYLSSTRSTLGSAMNRLSNAATNLQNTSTNLATAASGITDANFAAETTNLTRANILQQAGTAMLAQANSQPNQVMTLLQKL